MPHMSVIVPAYNSEATIEACLASIRQSTYRDYELIVVDDGSPDRTAVMAGPYADTVLRFLENRGAGAARNHGILAARGEIIVNIDADVVIRPDTLSVMRDFFAARPDVDAITGLLAEEHPHPEFFSQYKNLYMHHIFRRLPESVTFLYGSAHALRRESADFLYDADIKRANDTALGQKLLRCGKSIALVKQLEVVHLKRHDWRSFIKNDFLIPFDWGRIFVKYQGWKELGRKGSGYAHARPGQLASVMLAPTLVLLFVLTLAGHVHFVYPALGGAVWFLLNRTFIAYLTQARGLAFGAVSIPVTFLDHSVMAAGVAAGMASAWASAWSLQSHRQAGGTGPKDPSAS
jgi:glycosyltransferase involved in cell wall biosynthesis